MNTIKKNSLILFAIIAVFAACKKEESIEHIGGGSSNNTNTDNYLSLSKFYADNGVPMQTFTVDGAAGGSFTTPQGTVVTIPANAFMTEGFVPVTGSVTIEFKDIYKKSDMLLSDMGTFFAGGLLKSGGEFFIKASNDKAALLLEPGKQIEIVQPFQGLAADSAMRPWVLNDAGQWDIQNDTVVNTLETNYSASSYVFSLYRFNTPASNGSWCNSDNSSFFDAYAKTTLTLHPLDSLSEYSIDVFLVFKDINSMVHVYSDGTNFPYDYAPVGLKCTVVAIGLKDGKLYSSFTPITISANQTVNFKLAETTTDDFKTQLKALN